MALAAKILIVDDDVETRQLLAEELRDLGHESIHAADGVQAISLAWRERPDLILLDLRIPGGDGFSVLERLRSPDIASIPVIVFSGMRSPQAEELAHMLGACEFIHKSFDGNDLFEAIARALDRGAAPDPSVSRLAEQRIVAAALALTVPGGGNYGEVVPAPAEGSGGVASPPIQIAALRLAPRLDG